MIGEGFDSVRWRFLLVGVDGVRAACTSLESFEASIRLLGLERSAPMTTAAAAHLEQPLAWPVAHWLSPTLLPT